MLRQAFAAHHPLDVEGLHGQQPMLLDQGPAHFVLVVGPAVDDLLMLASNQLPLALPSSTAFLPPREASLQPAQPPFSSNQVAGIDQFTTIRQDRKVFQPQVKAVLTASADRIRLLYFDLEAGIVATALGSRYGHILQLTFQRPMKDGLDPADLRQVAALGIQICLYPLRVADRLLASTASETRISRPSLEEVLLGSIQVFEGLLQYLTVGFPEPLMFGISFEFSQQSCRVLIR
jgi:hypothetical protein